ncbi:TetR/AcrR family transcriptional regulator [Nocardia panacis]|uniref:TetR/AcrR family transcriptional regulator n=1 Tax=Nocardia panacis TaxID=2340916 RepID=A0A3A4KDG8_9NOCA|nr:TetR/AcrR family transcriptional regulator [Nocardia panacis]RJO73525.1 TetR/AcrR family transcriptional regulator [Nocardia panacis]
MSPTASNNPVRRVTRRRAQTRDRLLGAAYEVFAEEGFGRATVEQVCERAGFTRGAFYSNFGSLDELFLAMWESRSARLLADVRTAVEEMGEWHGTLRAAIERLVKVVPVDEAWFRITAEFTAHALRTAPLRKVVAAREAAIVAALMPPFVAVLDRNGRTVPDPDALGQALVAVHDGTATQVLLEPRSRAVKQRRVDLFHHIVLAYSTEIEGWP